MSAGKETMLQALGATKKSVKRKASDDGGGTPKRMTGSRRSHALREALQPIAEVLKLSVESSDRHAERMQALAEQNLEHKRQHMEFMKEQAKSRNQFKRQQQKTDNIMMMLAAGVNLKDAMQMFQS